MGYSIPHRRGSVGYTALNVRSRVYIGPFRRRRLAKRNFSAAT
jgi:hypothetical protein